MQTPRTGPQRTGFNRSWAETWLLYLNTYPNSTTVIQVNLRNSNFEKQPISNDEFFPLKMNRERGHEQETAVVKIWASHSLPPASHWSSPILALLHRLCPNRKIRIVLIFVFFKVFFILISVQLHTDFHIFFELIRSLFF